MQKNFPALFPNLQPILHIKALFYIVKFCIIFLKSVEVERKISNFYIFIYYNLQHRKKFVRPIYVDNNCQGLYSTEPYTWPFFL